MANSRRVLLTGFEPFGGNERNISADVVHSLQGMMSLANPCGGETVVVEIETDVLSVDEAGSKKTAERVEKGASWDAILHLGLCEQCDVPRLERLARDAIDMRIPDNSGRSIKGGVVDGTGHCGAWVDPSSWPSSFFPSAYTVSNDAGAYLCNETYHRTMKALLGQEHTSSFPSPCLFLHLPGSQKMALQEAVSFVSQCLAFLMFPAPSDTIDVVAGYLPNAAGHYLVSQRPAGDLDEGLWEFPGGKCESGERWSSAIERELLEELDVAVVAHQPMGTWLRQRGDFWFAIHLIRCETNASDDSINLSAHDAWQRLDPDSPPQLSWAGRDGEMNEFVLDVF